MMSIIVASLDVKPPGRSTLLLGGKLIENHHFFTLNLLDRLDMVHPLQLFGIERHWNECSVQHSPVDVVVGAVVVAS